MLVAECPALCNPDGIRVAGGDRTVDGLAVFCEQLVLADGVTFFYREFHFIETVGKPISCLAEFFFPLLYEKFSDFAEPW